MSKNVEISCGHAAASAYKAVSEVANDSLCIATQNFKVMFDSLPAAIYTTDAAGRLTSFNDAAVKLSGRVPELGTDQWCVTWKLYLPDGTPLRHEDCPMAIAIRDGTIIRGAECIAERPDGSRFWFTPFPTPIRDSGGTIIGGINMLVDITERKQAEQANQLLAAIVDSSDDAIISKDLNGIVTSWNKSAEHMFGYTAAEMIGKSITILIPPDRQDEEPAILARLQRGERIEHFETLRQRKDGTLLNISLTISPVKDRRGRIVGASKIARDITERKRAEDELRAANQDLEQLAFIASHDLQEPLRNITTSTQLLMYEYSPILDETAQKYMDSIVQGTARMRSLLKDVLAYTELRSIDPHPVKPVALDAVFRDVKQNLESQIKRSGASITSDPLPSVKGLPSHFLSLFQNLVENAIKYRSSDPLRISVSCRQTENELLFSFTDNGMGIDPAFHEKIFMPFKRLHGRKIPGTGVGLAICKRVVERYKGSIWVDSREGQGATFYISLPKEVLDDTGSK